MSKSFGKFLFGAAIIGAAAAGAYYLLKSTDRMDDFDDFDDDVNDDLEEFLKEEAEKGEREYVPLDLTKDDQTGKEVKIIGDVTDNTSNVVKESEEAENEAKEFKFTDLSGDDQKEDK